MSRTKLALLLAACILAAMPARAAISFVGKGDAVVSTAGTACPSAGSVALGGLANSTTYTVVATVGIAKDAATLSSITVSSGTGSLSSSVAISNAGSVRTEIWAGTIRSSAGASIGLVFNLSASVKSACGASAYSGVAALGVTGSSTSSAANPSISLTTQDSNNWCVASFSGTGTGTFTAGTGNLRYSDVSSGQGAASNVGGAANDNTVASPGTCTNTVTNADTSWANAVLELRTVAASPCPKTLLMMGVGC